MEEKNATKVLNQIKEIDDNITGVLVPILRDTVADYRKIVFKLIIVIVILIVGLIGLGITAQVIIARQIDKYNDFLSQFEFESDEYIQDLDTSNGDSIVNDGINVTK